jgi:ectoine hydroxylase
MTPEEVLSIKPKILSQRQRELYFENGYILVERLLSQAWIERLRATTDEMIERSRSIKESNAV